MQDILISQIRSTHLRTACTRCGEPLFLGDMLWWGNAMGASPPFEYCSSQCRSQAEPDFPVTTLRFAYGIWRADNLTFPGAVGLIKDVRTRGELYWVGSFNRGISGAKFGWGEDAWIVGDLWEVCVQHPGLASTDELEIGAGYSVVPISVKLESGDFVRARGYEEDGPVREHALIANGDFLFDEYGRLRREVWAEARQRSMRRHPGATGSFGVK